MENMQATGVIPGAAEGPLSISPECHRSMQWEFPQSLLRHDWEFPQSLLRMTGPKLWYQYGRCHSAVPAIGATSRLFVPAVYLNCSQDLMHHQINLGGPQAEPQALRPHAHPSMHFGSHFVACDWKLWVGTSKLGRNFFFGIRDPLKLQ